MDDSFLRVTSQGVEISVKVVPGASRNRVAGLLGNSLKIAVSAPPEKGKANQNVVDLLAKTLGIKRNAIDIVAGHTQPMKTVLVTGITADEIHARLGV